MKLVALFVLSLGMFVLQEIQAQHLGYRRYTVTDGLVQTEPTVIHQDKKGFIWIGTKNGISRFDGYEFRTIRDSAEISESWVQHIDNLNDSTIWILTKRGCLIYRYGKFTVSIKGYPVKGPVTGCWTLDGKGFFYR